MCLWSLTALCLQAREAGQVLSQDVDSLSARLSGSAPSCLDTAQRLAKEVGVLSDVSVTVSLSRHQSVTAASDVTFDPVLCVPGCREHPHPSVAAQRAAEPTPSSAEEQQHLRQEAGDQRGERTPETHLSLSQVH